MNVWDSDALSPGLPLFLAYHGTRGEQKIRSVSPIIVPE